MRMKYFLSFLFVTLCLSAFLIESANVQAKDCDYIDEDGYCVFVIDNSDDIPSIGEELTIENIEVNTEIKTDLIDSEDGFGVSGNEYQDLAKEYKEEFYQILNNNYHLRGDEKIYVNARLNGKSYTEAYRLAFSVDLDEGMKGISDNIVKNKEWYHTFFEAANSDSIAETFSNLGETISGWLTEWFGE